MIKCEKCNKEFKTYKALTGHMAWHVPRNDDVRLAKTRERAAVQKRANEEVYYQNPMECVQCQSIIPYNKVQYKKNDIQKSLLLGRKGNIFCGKSCAASYNNTHKTHGNRRSKLEVYLEEKLPALYPSLEFHFNRKDTINSELDIFIPSLKLAFELNGIYHYEPIHGKDKLESIQNNDNRKFQACLERNIELCIIDASKLTYFKESNAVPYLNIVRKIVEQKLLGLDLNEQCLTTDG